jgi:integrase/recombinase XerC
MSHLEVDNFIDYLNLQDKSPNTIAGYKIDLAQFYDWFSRTNKKELTLTSVTPLDIKSYRDYLEQRKLKPGSIGRKLNALSMFFRWARGQGKVPGNPVDNINIPHEVKRSPKWLSREQTYALLRAVDEQIQIAQAKGLGPTTVTAQRNAAVVVLLLHAGLRVSELCMLEIKDIQLSPRKGLVKVRRGKGRKYREVPLNADARRAIRNWLDVCQSKVYTFEYAGKPLHVRTIQWHLTRLGQIARLTTKVTPHVLRHTFGKYLVDAGVSLDQVAQLMGHSDVNTTSIYTAPSQDDLIRAVDKISWYD